MVKSFAQLTQMVAEGERQTVAVAAADDISILEVIQAAEQRNLANFILIGCKDEIHSLISQHNLIIKGKIVDESNHRKAADLAVQLVHNGQAVTLMKGMLHSSVFLKAILNKETGLNAGKYITQVAIMEKSSGDGLLMITDCAITLRPDLIRKKEIIENAVELAHSLGNENPKVAVLAALEVVNPSMPETTDAAILSKMAERGQIKGCVVDGPLAFDNIVSQEAAAAKGICSEVAGNADIVIVPDLVTGNALSKAISFIAQKTLIAATIGAKIPIVFNSRTESREGKLLTIALAVYCSINTKDV